MKIAVIKYNAGNITSVEFAFKRIGIDVIVTNNLEEIQSADKVVFPGVGEASSAMLFLKNNKLDELIKNLKQPVLGICLGMQLLCKYSEEGNTTCLGVFNHSIQKFKSDSLKIPQIGWNKINSLNASLFKGINESSYMYFVHSYFAEIGEHTIAKTNYTLEFSSALNYKNFYGVQFHPEKSSAAGEQLLRNFITL